MLTVEISTEDKAKEKGKHLKLLELRKEKLFGISQLEDHSPKRTGTEKHLMSDKKVV